MNSKQIRFEAESFVYLDGICNLIKFPNDSLLVKSDLYGYIVGLRKILGDETDNIIVMSIGILYRLKELYSKLSVGDDAKLNDTVKVLKNVITTSFILSHKFLTDDAYTNYSWVTITRSLYTLTEINMMEIELLHLLNFGLCVDDLTMKKIDKKIDDCVKDLNTLNNVNIK